MGFFKKKLDPISERSQALRAEIAALEAEIQQLSSRGHSNGHGQPRVRSTALPQGSAGGFSSAASASSASLTVFEPVDCKRIAVQTPMASGGQELGVGQPLARSLWARVAKPFRVPPAANPKLVSYLAAGSIKGLRPLRYEKRVARNRFLGSTILLVLLLYGIYAAFVRNY